MTSVIDDLARQGDPLERALCTESLANGTLAVVLVPYANVWQGFILPNREKDQGSMVQDEWIPFAQRHYSAIIRCWHVLHAFERIRVESESARAAQEGDDLSSLGRILLSLHEAIGSFFSSAGAAIENVQKAFEAYPLEFDKGAATRR